MFGAPVLRLIVPTGQLISSITAENTNRSLIIVMIMIRIRIRII